MSLLDTLGSLLGKSPDGSGGQQQTLITEALDLVNKQPGGLNGLIQQFQANGAGDVIKSWVGNGENQAISADTLHSVLGSDVVSSLAAKVGVQPEQAAGLLSQVLPHIVNTATPQGEVPAGGQLNTETVLGALGGLTSLFGKGGDASKTS